MVWKLCPCPCVLYMYVINLCHVQCKRILHYKGEVTLKRYDKHQQPTLSNQSCFKWSRLCVSSGLADTEKKSQIVIIISENETLLLGSCVQLGLALKHTCNWTLKKRLEQSNAIKLWLSWFISWMVEGGIWSIKNGSYILLGNKGWETCVCSGDCFLFLGVLHSIVMYSHLGESIRCCYHHLLAWSHL